jgi:hypothetical protein
MAITPDHGDSGNSLHPRSSASIRGKVFYSPVEITVISVDQR